VRWLALLVFGGVGLGMFIAGCVWGYESYVFSQVWVTTQGRVVEKGTSSDSETHHPVVEFWSAGEKQHRFTATGGSSVAYEVGATVSVLHDPGNPANARLADSKQTWQQPLALGLFGFVLLAGGIGSFFVLLHQERSDAMAKIRRENEVKRIMTEGNLLKGVVDSVRKEERSVGDKDDTYGVHYYDEYFIVCRATLRDGVTQERFEAAPIRLNPGPGILGKSVEIYVDPGDKTRYVVRLEPVLAELAKSKER